jgi:hypothetical protein
MSATSFADRKGRSAFSFAKSFGLWTPFAANRVSVAFTATPSWSSCAMSILCRTLWATAALVALTWNIPAHALSMHECGAKYRAAQSAKTLNGMSWKDFRKAECGAGAAAAPNGASSNTADTGTPVVAASPSEKSKRIYNTAPTGGSTDATFPSAVSPKYAGKSAGKARMLTCLDQYQANKTGNQNGGLKWIQRGGGYYSMCNKHLKGAGA